MAYLDTHTVIEELIASGASKKQAEVCVARFVLRNEIEDLEHRLATKSDLSELRLGTKLDISELRTELKSDISGIKVSMAEIKTDILKWMIPFFLGIVALNITTIGIVISYSVK